MMTVRRFVVVGSMFVVLVSGISVALGAQAAKPAAASATPKLSEDDTLMVQGVVAVAQLANEACQGLDSMKRYTQQLQQVSTRIETKYPGFHFNWQSGQLEVKPAK